MTQSQIRNNAKALAAKISALKSDYEAKICALQQELSEVRKACKHPSIPKDTARGNRNWQKTCNWGKKCSDCGYVVSTPETHFQ